MDKARHAFGQSSNLEAALQSGAIDTFDILFLDGDTEPKIGWVDKNGIVRMVEDKVQIVRVEELPTANGDENVVYIHNNEGYIWDGEQCVPISKSADVTLLETQVNELVTQIGQKVDATTVQNMIEEHYEAAIEVVEF